MNNAYALIMAGGAGTRLWPLSRKNHPKPLIPLVENERSMFQIAVERLDPLFPPERILVVANGELTPKLQKHAPRLPTDNFIVEPMGRDTAPAVGLGSIHVRHRDPDGVMAVLTADHHIAAEARFRQVLNAACQVASEEDSVVTLGITPGFPATGFGYIERGERLKAVDEIDVYKLVSFREKPDESTARQYVDSGAYSWNSGMFIWPVHRVMNEFKQHTPSLSADLERIASSIGGGDYDDVLGAIWPEIQRISVDYALMENIRENVHVIPVEMGWDDIGNFEALFDVLSAEGENVLHTTHQPVVFDTDGTLIFSQKRLVAAVGLENLVIIDTDDALLICRRDQAQDVKQIVENLKQEQRDEYL